MNTETEEFLEHYGVKGMKWGIRRSGKISSTTAKTSRLRRKSTDVTAKQRPGKYVKTSGGARRVAANDAVRIAAARQLAKKSTTDSLTNKQIQEAVQRMEMEQKYHRLVKKTDRRNRGRKFVEAIAFDKDNQKRFLKFVTKAAA